MTNCSFVNSIFPAGSVPGTSSVFVFDAPNSGGIIAEYSDADANAQWGNNFAFVNNFFIGSQFLP
jgi:hypothetical protein